MSEWTGTYILVRHVPVPVEDPLVWSKWFGKANRRVARTKVEGKVVSTVFLGLDHNYPDEPPELFETMIFAADDSELDYMTRAATWAEAEAMHAKAVEWVKRGCK